MLYRFARTKFSHGDCTRERGERERKVGEKSEGGVLSELVLFIMVHAAKLQCSISSFTLWPLSVAGSPVLKDINHCQTVTNYHPSSFSSSFPIPFHSGRFSMLSTEIPSMYLLHTITPISQVRMLEFLLQKRLLCQTLYFSIDFCCYSSEGTLMKHILFHGYLYFPALVMRGFSYT